MSDKKVFMTLQNGTGVFRLKLFNGLLQARKDARTLHLLAQIELNDGLTGFTWSNGQGLAIVMPKPEDEESLYKWMYQNPVDSGQFDEWTEMTPPPKKEKHCLAV